MASQRFESTPHFRVGDDSVVIQQVAGSVAHLLQLKDHSGSALMTINSSGQMSTSQLSTFDSLTVTTTATLPSGISLTSPSLTGTPTAPTAISGTNTTQIATTAFVRTEVSNLIASAPSALDTLDELAAALGDDANFATSLTNSLADKAPLSSPTFTGTVVLPSSTSIGNVSSTEVGYLDGVTSAIQTQLNSKVSSITAGTGITISGTTTPTVTNSGVTGLTGTANQITVSASTGAVTLSLPQSVVISGTAPSLQLRETTATANVDMFLGQSGTDGEGLRIRYESGTGHSRLTNIYAGNLYLGTNNANPWWLGSDNVVYHQNGNNSFTQYGPNATWNAYLRVGAAPNIVGNGVAQVISTDGNLHLDSGTAQDMYLNYYSGRPIRIHGFVNMNGQSIGSAGYIQAGATGITHNGSVSANNWFRSTTGTGWYNEAHAGGIWMYDNWIRTYNNKPFYSENELRTGNVFSGNASRSRGSYGAISIGGNGIANTWDGIEFSSPQTLMIQGEHYSGMYRNNNAWNWLYYYGTLVEGSDERFKREIQPLNAGLTFIEKLNPVSFLRLTETPDDDPEATEDGYCYGFTAQNVRAALDHIGEDRNVRMHHVGGPNMGLAGCREDTVYDRQYIGVNEFIAPIVKAIQELSAKVKSLEEKVS